MMGGYARVMAHIFSFAYKIHISILNDVKQTIPQNQTLCVCILRILIRKMH
ncbi:hypothetical protein MsAg5_09250 [Methanosarcinaceae archaeon Ag5]|uniref:Uncharacterized protein n=1 Tax=Methanolapillus africanus TaxID=3028297 RepID=A0AAE4SDY0_9EURY|nr:hypothetical protein [Methanosarcinaceae archaeon Ag5]